MSTNVKLDILNNIENVNTNIIEDTDTFTDTSDLDNISVDTKSDLELKQEQKQQNRQNQQQKYKKAKWYAQKSNTQLKKEHKQRVRFINLLDEYKRYDDRFRWFDVSDFLKYMNRRKEPKSWYEYVDNDKYEPYDEVIEDFIDDVLDIFPDANDKIILNIIVNKLKKYYTGYLYNKLTDK